jgi:hypothetical protein
VGDNLGDVKKSHLILFNENNVLIEFNGGQGVR